MKLSTPRLPQKSFSWSVTSMTTVVSSIMRTGATAAEILQAVQWFQGGGGLEDEPGHEPHGAIKAVYEILQAEEPEEP